MNTKTAKQFRQALDGGNGQTDPKVRAALRVARERWTVLDARQKGKVRAIMGPILEARRARLAAKAAERLAVA